MQKSVSDDFKHFNAYWRAVLTNEEVWFERDHKSWLELKQYCMENNLKVESLFLHFRSNTMHVCTNKDVYLCKGILAVPGQTKQTYTAGYVDGENVLLRKVIVPELLVFEEEVRPLEQTNSMMII